MLIVTGSVTARSESFEALLHASIEHVQRSRTEDGCIGHSVQVDCENPLRLFFYEHWRDMAALKAHFAVEGTRDFIEQVRRLAAASEPVAIYEAAPVGI